MFMIAAMQSMLEERSKLSLWCRKIRSADALIPHTSVLISCLGLTIPLQCFINDLSACVYV